MRARLAGAPGVRAGGRRVLRERLPELRAQTLFVFLFARSASEPGQRRNEGFFENERIRRGETYPEIETDKTTCGRDATRARFMGTHRVGVSSRGGGRASRAL